MWIWIVIDDNVWNSLNWLDIMQNWSTKDEIEVRIGTFYAFPDEIEVNIYKM